MQNQLPMTVLLLLAALALNPAPTRAQDDDDQAKAQEERERATELLVLVLSGVLLALFALLFASIFVIAYFWEGYRLWAIAGVTLFYVALAILTFMRLKRRRREKPTAFAATLAELGHDISALRRES